MLREDFIIEIFCMISDWMKMNKNSMERLRSRGPKPKLGDDEVLTMGIVGEFFGIDTDKGIHRYFVEHWRTLFPHIGHRTAYVRQSAHLWGIKQELHKYITQTLISQSAPVYCVDGFPLPLCNFRRANRCRLFKGQASYGFCAAKNMHYYGFKGHILITADGLIIDYTLTPANVDEREAAEDFCNSMQGILLGDKGYIGKAPFFAEHNIALETPVRKNMKQIHSPEQMSWMMNTRRIIETVISQLSERFHIQKIRARDIWHFTSRLWRKLLAHTMAVYLCKKHCNSWLEFRHLCG